MKTIKNPLLLSALLVLSPSLPGAPAGSIDPAFNGNQIPLETPGVLLNPDDATLKDVIFSGFFTPEEDLNKFLTKSGGAGLKKVNSWVLQPDGKFLVGGVSGKNLVLANDPARVRKIINWGKKQYSLNRFDPNGSVDGKFRPGADEEAMKKGRGVGKKLEIPGEVTSLALQADGKILMAGEFKFGKAGLEVYFTRLLPNGAIDGAFQKSLDAWAGRVKSPIKHFALQADGKIIVAGEFRSIGKTPTSTLARLLPDGALDPSFDPPSSRDEPQALIIQPDGRIVVQSAKVTIRLLNDPVVDEFKHHGNGAVTWKRGGAAPEIVRAILQVKRRGKWQVHSELQRIKGGWRSLRKVNEKNLRVCGIVRLNFPSDKYYAIVQTP